MVSLSVRHHSYLQTYEIKCFSVVVTGLTTLEEGAVDGQKIVLKTSEENLVRMGADPAKAKQGARVTQVKRSSDRIHF